MSDPIFLKSLAGDIAGRVNVPGSKSVANRALVCAYLADGVSHLSNIPNGEDTRALIEALFPNNEDAQNGNSEFSVVGVENVKLPSVVHARLAGTTSRFLTAVAALGLEPTRIDGDPPLRSRPMSDLHDALKSIGAVVEPQMIDGFLPVLIRSGSTMASSVSISGAVSSQFISALMLIGPCLKEGLEINIQGDLVSKSYVDMTAKVMSEFGAHVEVKNQVIKILNSPYSPRKYVVEPDFSSAAFAICAVLIRGGELELTNLSLSKLQGDSAILEIAKNMGASVATVGDDIKVSRDADQKLRAISLNMSDCSDLVPAVAVACCVANGVSNLSGIGFIRSKESDRLEDLARELNRMGASVLVKADGLEIHGGTFRDGVLCNTYHDHRLAMAFALCALAVDNVGIDDGSVVSKSWPSYFADMSVVLGQANVQN